MGTTRGRCSRRALLGAGLTLGLTVGCTAVGDSEPTPTGPPTYDGPGLPPLAVEKRFTGSEVELTQVFRATRVRDTLVLGGRDGDDRSIVAAIDPSNGKPRWETRTGDDELRVDSGRASLLGSDGWAVDDGRAGVVLERYVAGADGGDATEEFGIAGLSLTDRSLRWTAVVLPIVSKDDPDRKRYEGQIVHVVATTATTVVVNVGGDAIHGVGWNRFNPGQAPRTIGIDSRTGKKLWEVPDTLTQLAAGDRLLAIRGTGPDDSRALALDPVTGKDLWQLPDGEPATWITGGGDLGIIRTGAVGTLVGLTDGKVGPPVKSIPGGQVQLGNGFIHVISPDDAHPYAAWGSEGGDYRLVTLALSDREPVRAGTAFPGHSLVMAGGGGYAWVMPTDGPDRVLAVDRTGAGRSDELDGFLRGVVGDLVITDDVDGGFAVHQYRPA